MIILYSMDFGKTLRELRKNTGLTQLKFAQAVGVTQTAVAHYERNARKPEMEKLPEFAKALGVGVEDLFDDPTTSNNKTTKKWVHKNSREVKILEMFNKLIPAKQENIFKIVKELIKK